MLPVTIFFVFYMLLSVLASGFMKTALWGLSSWAFVSLPLGLALAGILTATIFFLAFPVSRKSAGRPHGTSAAVPILAACASIAVLWLLRMRPEFWGDRYTVAAAAEGGRAVLPGAPLATSLNWLFYRLLNGTFLWNGSSSSALLSVLAGSGFILASFHAARLAAAGEGGEHAPRTLYAAVLFSNGFAAVFFGAGGTAPVCTLFTLLFLISALRFLRDDAHPLEPAAMLLLAVFSHLAAVYLVPAFLYMLTVGLRDPGRRRSTIYSAAAFLACWVALDRVFHAIGGVAPPTARILASVSSSVGDLEGAGMRGVPRLLYDALNGILVTGPAAAAALVLLAFGWMGGGRAVRERSGRVGIFLLLCSASALLLFPFGAGRLGGGLGWMILAPTGPALAIYVLHKLSRTQKSPAALRRCAVLLILLGAFHTIPIILSNTLQSASEARLLGLPLSPGRGEMILGSAALDEADPERAQEWFSKSLEKDPENDMAHFKLGEIDMELESFPSAIHNFYRAYKLVPDLPRYRFMLAEALIANRWFAEAIDQLDTLTTTFPESVLYWRRLGYANNHSKRFSAAVAAYEKALEIRPDAEENKRNLVSALLNRGAELQEDGKPEEARKFYSRVMGFYPGNWVAFNNLAAMEMIQENYEKAYDILERALQLHPLVSELNYNMGLVLEKLGREKEALDRLRASLRLDPMSSKAGEHIRRLERRLSGAGKE